MQTLLNRLLLHRLSSPQKIPLCVSLTLGGWSETLSLWRVVTPPSLWGSRRLAPSLLYWELYVCFGLLHRRRLLLSNFSSRNFTGSPFLSGTFFVRRRGPVTRPSSSSLAPLASREASPARWPGREAWTRRCGWPGDDSDRGG